MIGSQSHMTVWGVPRVPCVLAKNSFTENFSKWINIQIKHCKTFHCRLSKISLHYQTVIDQRITLFNQLFSCTSVGPSKYPIDKMISSQGHLTVWTIPWIQCAISKNSITKWMNILRRHSKKWIDLRSKFYD